MNSCAYEEKMKRVEIYQSWLQEKQGMDITACQKRVKLLDVCAHCRMNAAQKITF